MYWVFMGIKAVTTVFKVFCPTVSSYSSMTTFLYGGWCLSSWIIDILSKFFISKFDGVSIIGTGLNPLYMIIISCQVYIYHRKKIIQIRNPRIINPRSNPHLL